MQNNQFPINGADGGHRGLPSRRQIAVGAAWTVPLVTVGAAAPARAASPCSTTPITKVFSHESDTYSDYVHTIHVDPYCTTILFEVTGGMGGGTVPGGGALLKGTLNLGTASAAIRLDLVVGGGGKYDSRGGTTAGGLGYGNGGISPGAPGPLTHGGGGGGSAIMLGDAASKVPLVVAGGGGGMVNQLAGFTEPYTYAQTDFDGNWWGGPGGMGSTSYGTPASASPYYNGVNTPDDSYIWISTGENPGTRMSSTYAGGKGAVAGAGGAGAPIPTFSVAGDTGPNTHASLGLGGTTGQSHGSGNFGGGNGGDGTTGALPSLITYSALATGGGGGGGWAGGGGGASTAMYVKGSDAYHTYYYTRGTGGGGGSSWRDTSKTTITSATQVPSLQIGDGMNNQGAISITYVVAAGFTQ